jgi:hypothetical protein
MTRPDPPRLVRSGTRAAEVLGGYAQRTAPGERGTAAAWYRLRRRLDGGPDAGSATAPVPAPALAFALARLRRLCSPARVFTLVLGLAVLARLIPLTRVPDTAFRAPLIGEDGVAGWRGGGGAGGMEGAGG